MNHSRRFARDRPGPKITAFQIMILSGHGAPLIPPGGSEERRLKSRIRRLRDAVDCWGGKRDLVVRSWSWEHTNSWVLPWWWGWVCWELEFGRAGKDCEEAQEKECGPDRRRVDKGRWQLWCWADKSERTTTSICPSTRGKSVPISAPP